MILSDKINGWMWILRLILPALITIMLFMVHDIRSNQRILCTSFDDIKDNLHHEVLEIKQRLTAVETLLRGHI